MPSTTLKTRIVLCSKNSASWATETTVALNGEPMVEWVTQGAKTFPRMKIGDGVNAFKDLPYIDRTDAEIQAMISSMSYTLPTASDSELGGVKIGTNINIDATTGAISVSDGSTAQKGVVKLSDAINSTASTTAATSKAVKSAYDRGSTGITDAANALSVANSKIGSVTIAGGTNNGTIKVTVDEDTTDNIAVTGLKSAAYTESSAYATAAQGTKADNAMPKSGGTFTGAVTLKADPTANLGAATKQYVDTQIANKIAASDAMVFKGTIGTDGTVTAIPTTGVVKGDTYKVITAGTYADSSCKVGDLLIAMASGDIAANTTNWAYVPSGDESTTSIKYSTSTQNLTTTAKTGEITLGEGATKQVDASISAGSTSTNIPTSKAVAEFVEGKNYVTTDEKVKAELKTTTKGYVTATTSNTTNTGTQIFDTGVYLDTTAGTLHATKMTATTFEGALSGNVTGNVSGDAGGNAATATALKASKNFSISGNGTAAAVAFDGSSNVDLKLNSFDAKGLTQTTGDYLILDGSF